MLKLFQKCEKHIESQFSTEPYRFEIIRSYI